MGLNNETAEEAGRVDGRTMTADSRVEESRAERVCGNPDSARVIKGSVEDAIIKRALSYPYARPSGSYLFRDGSSEAFAGTVPSGLHFVLAIGSNASPEQLQRKYGDGVSIPVISVEVEGLDVVYAGIMSGYGSIPATVLKSAGTVTSMHATLVTDKQLGRMHETEGGYYFCRLVDGMGVRVFWDGAVVQNVFCYVARRGALCNDQVFALEEIAARKRRYAVKSQTQIQQAVKALVGWGEDVREFVLRNVENRERRLLVMSAMKGTEKVEDCFRVVVDAGAAVSSVK